MSGNSAACGSSTLKSGASRSMDSRNARDFASRNSAMRLSSRSLNIEERGGRDWRRSHALRVRGERLFEIAGLVRCQHLSSRFSAAGEINEERSPQFFIEFVAVPRISSRLKPRSSDRLMNRIRSIVAVG